VGVSFCNGGENDTDLRDVAWGVFTASGAASLAWFWVSGSGSVLDGPIKVLATVVTTGCALGETLDTKVLETGTSNDGSFFELEEKKLTAFVVFTWTPPNILAPLASF